MARHVHASTLQGFVCNRGRTLPCVLDPFASTLQGFVCNRLNLAAFVPSDELQPYKGSSVTILDLRETRLLTCGYNKELLSTLNKLHSTEG